MSTQSKQSVERKWPPVLIIWHDSATSHGWMEADKDPGNVRIRTLGFLVHETSGKLGCYRVAHSEDDNYVNGVIDIPKACVLEYYILDMTFT